MVFFALTMGFTEKKWVIKPTNFSTIDKTFKILSSVTFFFFIFFFSKQYDSKINPKIRFSSSNGNLKKKYFIKLVVLEDKY